MGVIPILPGDLTGAAGSGFVLIAVLQGLSSQERARYIAA